MRTSKAKRKESEELVQVVIDPRDGRKDVLIPKWKLRHLIIRDVICWDKTNNKWCSKDGKPLPE